MDTGKRNHMQRHLPLQTKIFYDERGPVEEVVAIRRPMFYPPPNNESQPLFSCTAASNSALLVPTTTRSVISDTVNGVPVQNIQITRDVQILPNCKHVDRKQARQQCQGVMKIRPHKRGFLTVVCELGHQWVWCAYCCDCPGSGIGCVIAQHWMERDSFDTGKRNHMQRHLENYDAGRDADGALLARSDPRQVAMARHPHSLVLQQPAAGAGQTAEAPTAKALAEPLQHHGAPLRGAAAPIAAHPARAAEGSRHEVNELAAQPSGPDRDAEVLPTASDALHRGSSLSGLQTPHPSPGKRPRKRPRAQSVSGRGAPPTRARGQAGPGRERAPPSPGPAQGGGGPARGAGGGRPPGEAATEDELRCMDVAATALIALRRSARISGAADE
jgi:hypothetical protein